VHQTFPCDPAQVAVVRRWAAEVLGGAGFARWAIADVELALSEAVTNVMVHSGQRGDGCIRLSIEVDDERALVVVRDGGRCFDPAEYRPPPLDDLAAGGFGVFLMREVMDGVEFVSDDTGNELRMWKCRTPPARG
jgi:serine/threonine-protein kinase RsbW